MASYLDDTNLRALWGLASCNLVRSPGFQAENGRENLGNSAESPRFFSFHVHFRQANTEFHHGQALLEKDKTREKRRGLCASWPWP